MEIFLLVVAGWVFSVCLHEFGHAWVAYRGGDYTVKEKGYLTLNPIHYTHPIYSLVLPIVFLLLGGIGLPGGAVYINDHMLRSKKWRTGVSLAGPAMNVILIVVICVPFWLGLLNSPRAAALSEALAFLLQLQISAVIFNLIPVPPLDGFQALAPWMPYRIVEKIMVNSNAIFFTLLLLMWYAPPLQGLFWGTIIHVSAALGVDPGLGALGWRGFQFWKGGL